ncbi:hypothetical protein [Empedobacter brevis]|uniref:hypothetical protein n=1 Tax=Empedobacter brevis TaxID=247 RepID=UPI002FE04A14
MIIFDFVAYKVYKMVVKYKQYEGIEWLPVTGAMTFSIVPLMMIIITEIEKYFFGGSIISQIAEMGKIPSFLMITLPIMIIIYFYLRFNLHKIQDQIARSKPLQILDKLPNFLVYFIFVLFSCFLAILIHKLCNNS